MNLGEIRQQLLMISGRSDLVDEDTFADLGADYYINAGQRWLDVHFIGKNAKGRYFHQWPAGTYNIHIPACRAIHEVWAYDTESKWELEKKDLDWMRANFPGDWRSLDRGGPLYYAPNVLRLFQTTTEMTMGEADFAANQANVMTASPFTYDGILILAPPDTVIDIEVIGLFHANPLIENDDISWWSVRYPDVLINAALRSIEIAHRNTQGVNDWTGAIVDVMGSLDQDQVTEEITDINEMRG